MTLCDKTTHYSIGETGLRAFGGETLLDKNALEPDPCSVLGARMIGKPSCIRGLGAREVLGEGTG